MRELSTVASFQAAENNSTVVRRTAALFHAEEGHFNQGKLTYYCFFFMILTLLKFLPTVVTCELKSAVFFRKKKK